MDWPQGTKVKHDFLPGIFTIQGSIYINEIGYALIPVLDQSGKNHWVNPRNLMKVAGGVRRGGIGVARNSPGNLLRLQEGLF